MTDELRMQVNYSALRIQEEGYGDSWEDIFESHLSLPENLFTCQKTYSIFSRDKISISSDTPGENMDFRCFCPKIFSSIHPFHAMPETAELARRLLVIPTKRVEDLSDNQKARLGITGDDWESRLIDIDSISWKGFSDEYRYFWDAEASSLYMTMKREIARSLRGLKSHQKNLCLDLVTTGITCGIWDDVRTARDRLKTYFAWLDADTKDTSDNLLQLLERYVQQEEENAKAAQMPPAIYNANLKATIQSFYSQGWVLDKPTSKSIKNAMAALGYRLVEGKWVKR